jgi:hypothetical protein
LRDAIPIEEEAVMALQVMTVCETTNAKFPYEFNAETTINGVNVVKVVKLVMPFGGKETGFYRYPRKGESILVDIVILLYSTYNTRYTIMYGIRQEI